MRTATYSRQSIEKQDSVSIEAQFEKCELICKLNNWDSVRYSDIGYSGSNINRPGFEKLISDIKKGKINRVISYRLDRISRSITDFAKLLELFENYNVQYISATENFDTSNPLGRAMVYIVMVFAQLERETITQRITDNYYFRAKQGLFTGGNTPLGYRSIKVDRNGKKASILEVDPNSLDIVNQIFHLFVTENYNAHKIALYLNEHGIKTQKDCSWSRVKVLRILQNPVYVANTADVYGYLSSKGFIMANSPEEYTGEHGLGVFGKDKNYGSKRKSATPSEQVVAIGEFKPIISSDIWLTAQNKIACTKPPSRLGTSNVSWLSGLIFCSICGHSMSTKSSTKNNIKYNYIVCRGRSARGNDVCSNSMYYELSELENYIEGLILTKIDNPIFLEALTSLEINIDSGLSITKNTLLTKVYSKEKEINTYIDQIGSGTVIDKYLNQKITALDNEKAILLKEVDEIDLKLYSEGKSIIDTEHLKDVTKKVSSSFKNSEIQTKKLLSTSLIKKILLDDNKNITIEWYL